MSQREDFIIEFLSAPTGPLYQDGEVAYLEPQKPKHKFVRLAQGLVLEIDAAGYIKYHYLIEQGEDSAPIQCCFDTLCEVGAKWRRYFQAWIENHSLWVEYDTDLCCEYVKNWIGEL